VYMGEGVGQVDAIRPAGQVITDICEAAENAMRDIYDKTKQQG